VGKLVPRMKQTAKLLYMIYIALTALCFIFLLFGDMSWLEALCTAFGTAGTGGFGVRNDSMASFNAYTQIVTTVFMFLFGINFSCYYLILLKKIKGVFFDEELRLYVLLAAASIGLIAWNIYGIYGNLADTLRHSAFQVSTVMTTTGFSTADFDQWPAFSKGILLMLMMVGACAGSTGGGFKCGRLLLVLKSLGRNIRKILNPQKVQVIRNNGKVVSENILDNTNAYLAAYVIIVVACFTLISLDGFSVETNFSATLACFNNIGPGFAAVGPMCNYSAYSAFSKILLSIAMLAGRLEIFPILVLFSRRTWTKR
jgi:trk system potassium uptake protein TrkH